MDTSFKRTLVDLSVAVSKLNQAAEKLLQLTDKTQVARTDLNSNLGPLTEWEMDQLFQAFARTSIQGGLQPHTSLRAAIEKFIELRTRKS